MQRVKYPLTQEAKEAARYLVEAWAKGEVAQRFTFFFVLSGDARLSAGNLSGTFLPPSLNILLELAKFQLIYVDATLYGGASADFGGKGIVSERITSWHVLLMQELRNAVEQDFQVSDYFLTFNAVGTIIQGDATISAPFQSVGLSHGNVSQQITSSELADKLLAMIASDVLQSNPDLTAAIQELRTSLENERQSKLGKVISQLGRSLEHVNNAKGIIEAIAFLSMIIQQAI